MEEEQILFGKPFKKNTVYEFNKLDLITDFAHDAHRVIGNTDWQKQTDNDIEIAINNLKAGFIGNIAVTNARLVVDGVIKGDFNSQVRTLDGVMLEIPLFFKPTGYPDIPYLANVVFGNGSKRFEVRAYDLSTKRFLTTKKFGEISCTALKNYLASRSQIGSVSGGSGKRTSRSSQNLGSFD